MEEIAEPSVRLLTPKTGLPPSVTLPVVYNAILSRKLNALEAMALE